MPDDIINFDLSIIKAKNLCNNLSNYFKHHFCEINISEVDLENDDLVNYLIIKKATGFDDQIKKLTHHISLLQFKYKRLLYYRYIIGYNASSLKNGLDGIYIRDYNKNHHEALRKLVYTDINLLELKD